VARYRSLHQAFAAAAVAIAVAGGGATLAGCSDAPTRDRDAARTDDGGAREAAADLPPIAIDAPYARPPICGGTSDVSGSTIWGDFSAPYVYVTSTGGDCRASVTLVLATGAISGGLALTLSIFPQDQTSGSFLGQRTSSGRIGADDDIRDVIASIDITSAHDLEREGMGALAGTFTIESSWATLFGSFSSPICRALICI
jgi:hypothetical protein